MIKTITQISDLLSDKFPAVLAITALVILFLCGGKSYLNIFDIIKCYFKDFIMGNVYIGLALYISPIFFAFSIYLSHETTKSDIDIITVSISIIITLFFTFLELFNKKKKDIQCNEDDYSVYKQKNETVNENISIVSYEILVSIMILICCFIFNYLPGIFIVIIYSMYIHLLLNLLLILKRVHKNSDS